MRVLAIICFSFSAAVFAGVYLLPFAWLFALALICAVAAALLLLMRKKWLRPLVLTLFAAGIGFGWFALHDLLTVIPAGLLDGSVKEVRAEILDYPQIYPNYCRVTVSANIDGLRTMDALVYDNTSALAGAEPGDDVIFQAKLSRADRRYGSDYDAYAARDIYLKLNTRSEPVITKKADPFARFPLRFHHRLLARISTLFPKDTRAFLQSLMLGDKRELYQDKAAYLALSRAGNMHALAVSGLHIAFLVGMLQLLLGKNAFSSVLCIGITWAFVLITGASPSAVRAGVMQSLLLLAPILRRENDPATTLSFALALILLPNPRAAASVSLQLSFAAMAGILCFGGGLHRWFVGLVPRGFLFKPAAASAAAFASSLAVLPFTVPLMALHFGFLSLISPLTSILCSLAISCCFCLGYVSCLLSILLAPLGRWAAWLTAVLVRYLLWISEALSSIPHAVLYLEMKWCVPWLVVCYLLFIGARFLPWRRVEKLLYPAVLSVLSMLLLLSVTREHYRLEDGYLSVLDVGQGQCICALAGDETVMIDCGSIMSLDNAGEVAGRWLISHGRRQVDTLVLTHLDTDHLNGVTMLMEMLPVKRVIVPANAPDETAFLPELYAAAKAHGSECVSLQRDGLLSAGSLSVNLYAPLTKGESNDSGLFAILHFGVYDVLVTGDASIETEQRFLMHALPSDLELLVAGHHGAKNASGEALLRACGADTALISVGYNTYGHPAQETLERLAACGYNVFRTDEDGTIVFHIEDGHGEKER